MDLYGAIENSTIFVEFLLIFVLAKRINFKFLGNFWKFLKQFARKFPEMSMIWIWQRFDENSIVFLNSKPYYYYRKLRCQTVLTRFRTMVVFSYLRNSRDAMNAYEAPNNTRIIESP